MSTFIDIMRHGEPVGGRRYRGSRIDDDLTKTGWAQMQASTDKIFHWQQIVSSPLLRCANFSQYLAQKNNIPYQLEAQLKEIGFGAWEGKTPEQIVANNKNALKDFYQDPINNRPAGAELLDDFSQRVWQAYQAIAKKHQGQRVLIVAHAGVIRVIMANILNLPLNKVYQHLKIEYGAIVSTAIDDSSLANNLLTKIIIKTTN